MERGLTSEAEKVSTTNCVMFGQAIERPVAGPVALAAANSASMNSWNCKVREADPPLVGVMVIVVSTKTTESEDEEINGFVVPALLVWLTDESEKRPD